LQLTTGFQSKTTLNQGVDKFVEWYKSYYQKKFT